MTKERFVSKKINNCYDCPYFSTTQNGTDGYQCVCKHIGISSGRISVDFAFYEEFAEIKILKDWFDNLCDLPMVKNP